MLHVNLLFFRWTLSTCFLRFEEVDKSLSQNSQVLFPGLFLLAVVSFWPSQKYLKKNFVSKLIKFCAYKKNCVRNVFEHFLIFNWSWYTLLYLEMELLNKVFTKVGLLIWFPPIRNFLRNIWTFLEIGKCFWKSEFNSFAGLISGMTLMTTFLIL